MDATVVVVATAGGLKDPGVTAHRLGDVPVVPPSLEAALEVLRAAHGFQSS